MLVERLEHGHDIFGRDVGLDVMHLAEHESAVWGEGIETLPDGRGHCCRELAVCRDEAGEHLAAMAVPVRAALGISLPTVRLSSTREKNLARLLRRTAAQIAARWGWSNP